jgi:hypothetical protein
VDVTSDTRSHRDLLRIWLPAVCLLALLIGGASIALARSQSQSRSAIEQRYALRATLASRFVGAYIADVRERETEYVTRSASTSPPRPSDSMRRSSSTPTAAP